MGHKYATNAIFHAALGNRFADQMIDVNQFRPRRSGYRVLKRFGHRIFPPDLIQFEFGLSSMTFALAFAFGLMVAIEKSSSY